MEKRPRIKLIPTLGDIILELIGYLSLFSLWYLVAINYYKLPETIPVHYNAAGKADNFGGKETIFVLPIIATILFIGMTILNRFPHTFNYPVRITEENALRQYVNASRMIRYLKFIIVAIFGVITFKTIPNSAGTSDGLGEWFLPLTLISICVPIFYYVVKSCKTQ